MSVVSLNSDELTDEEEEEMDDERSELLPSMMIRTLLLFPPSAGVPSKSYIKI